MRYVFFLSEYNYRIICVYTGLKPKEYTRRKRKQKWMIVEKSFGRKREKRKREPEEEFVEPLRIILIPRLGRQNTSRYLKVVPKEISSNSSRD